MAESSNTNKWSGMAERGIWNCPAGSVFKGAQMRPHIGENWALKEQSVLATNQGSHSGTFPTMSCCHFFVNSTFNMTLMPENTHFLFAGGFAELTMTKRHHTLFLLSGNSSTGLFTFYEDKWMWLFWLEAEQHQLMSQTLKKTSRAWHPTQLLPEQGRELRMPRTRGDTTLGTFGESRWQKQLVLCW